jgi:hypothetical protein
MRTKAYTLFVIPGALLALPILDMSLTQPAAHAQNGFDCANVTDAPTSDCEALVALYNATGGENWQYSNSRTT